MISGIIINGKIYICQSFFAKKSYYLSPIDSFERNICTNFQESCISTAMLPSKRNVFFDWLFAFRKIEKYSVTQSMYVFYGEVPAFPDCVFSVRGS